MQRVDKQLLSPDFRKDGTRLYELGHVIVFDEDTNSGQLHLLRDLRIIRPFHNISALQNAGHCHQQPEIEAVRTRIKNSQPIDIHREATNQLLSPYPSTHLHGFQNEVEISLCTK